MSLKVNILIFKVLFKIMPKIINNHIFNFRYYRYFILQQIYMSRLNLNKKIQYNFSLTKNIAQQAALPNLIE